MFFLLLLLFALFYLGSLIFCSVFQFFYTQWGIERKHLSCVCGFLIVYLTSLRYGVRALAKEFSFSFLFAQTKAVTTCMQSQAPFFNSVLPWFPYATWNWTLYHNLLLFKFRKVAKLGSSFLPRFPLWFLARISLRCFNEKSYADDENFVRNVRPYIFDNNHFC